MTEHAGFLSAEAGLARRSRPARRRVILVGGGLTRGTGCSPRACARRHQRLLSVLAFGLLALVAELVGRSLTHRVDLGRHVQSSRYAGADYYPFLLAAVKVGSALLLARLFWRVGRARAAEQAARRFLAGVGRRPEQQSPRVRLRLSPRLWAAVFALTSLIYLVQTDAEGLSSGHSAVFGPWLHSSALPAFAVLGVVVAFLWSAVQRWLADYERYAERTVAQARQLFLTTVENTFHAAKPWSSSPRRLFGLAFESRPPPLVA